MDALIQDLKYALRSLRKNPGFTLAAVLILGLGIGANATIFSVVNAVLLRPPAYVQEPERMVALYTSDYSGPRFSSSSIADYRDFRDRSDVFEGVLAFTLRPLSLSDGKLSERGLGTFVTANYFSLLGVQPVAGRGFLPEEDQAGTAPVAVISHQFWQQHYGGDAAAVGNSVRIGGRPFTIVGVAPEGFEGLLRGPVPDVFVPMGVQMADGENVAERLASRGNRGLILAARLKPGKTQADAETQMAVVASQLFGEFPRQWTDVKQAPRVITLIPLTQSLVFPRIRSAVTGFMALLMVVVGLVLLIACANVANLLLARAAARRKEIAIRLSLGAARGRVIRQLLTESLALGVLAGAVGLAIAIWTNGLISGFRPPVPVTISLAASLDARVVGFIVVVSLLTAVGFGLAPALQLVGPAARAGLKDDLGAASGPRRQRLRNTLVIVQMAVSLVLLVGGGLLIRALRSGQAIDPGFDPDHTALMSMNLELQGYSSARGKAFIQQVIEKVGAVAGVETAALGSMIPLDQFAGERRGLAVQGYTPQQGEDMEFSDNVVTPGYFKAIGLELVRGRPFAESDGDGAPGVVVVNETFARRFWSGADPLGKRISLRGDEGPWLEVVGVMRDGKYSTLGEEAKPYFLVPLAQMYQGGINLYARTPGDPALLLQPIREAIRSLDPDLPVFDMRTLRDHVNISLLPQRIAATLLGAFGGLALLLATMGIYSVIAYSVSQRTREIGIRVALGASRDEVVKLVLKQGMVLVAIGGGIGIVIAGGVSHLIHSLLYGVSALDPLTFGGVALLLGAVALLACYLPARRAARVDPVVALRSE